MSRSVTPFITTPHYARYRQDVEQLIEAAWTAVDPQTAVARYLSRQGTQIILDPKGQPHFFAASQGRIFLVAIGKAAVPMLRAALDGMGDLLTAGVVVAKKGERDWQREIASWEPDYLARLTLFEAGHPLSDETSVAAATAVWQMLAQTQPGDLVLCLISGGASALFAWPRVPLADWQQLTEALLASGCTINELNTVRRQLDRVKGGGLAQAAAPAACVSLILSDVVGNSLPIIGSGPTVFTGETPADALQVLERYGVEQRLATAVWQRIDQVLHQLSQREQPPKLPAVNRHIIVGDIHQAATGALIRAVQRGFVAEILTTHLEGEAREVGRVVAAIAKDTLPGRCRILGGETTVTLRGSGRGGRNQELALAAAIALAGVPYTVLASLATDGEDGPFGTAGAVVTGETAVVARRYQLEPTAYLSHNDSLSFFEAHDQRVDPGQQALLRPGPTGTNVNDLIFILTYPDDNAPS